MTPVRYQKRISFCKEGKMRFIGHLDLSLIHIYTSTLANDGTVYNLYLVDHISNYAGDVIYQTKPVVDHQANVSQSSFDTVREGMVAMAESTQQLVEFMANGISVAGKTGTAQEINNRPPHALFTGYTLSLIHI